MSVDLSQYKVCIVLRIEDSGKNNLRACTVDVGDNEPVTIVTAASNVREGSRLAVALVGSNVLDDSGEEIEIKRTPVGGVMSDGMFLNGKMLGWTGGSGGNLAQLIPDEFEVGSTPPAEKPRPKDTTTEEMPASDAPGLFEKKLTKEEKKKLAEERKKARAAKKAEKS